ncbi:amidohydrolase family protein [Kitasatospora sp. RB6PN24]|uniref:amidohydrolase family protein n=1 Tax=Kitasatospora humi TaxID=2893891 RepID=UPI001E39024D|nr:amidohydrolase family protein [Kitasatospora humi]MCC9306078.1 amidohydrolase family protein [Kitasatospora humi]
MARRNTRPLVSALGFTRTAQVEELLDVMEDWRGTSDQWLSVWGVKFGLDGGLEAGATEEPYACDHSYSGVLMWEPDALVEAVEAVVRRGWRVGTHAYGDRAVRTLLDVYERVLERNPGLPAGTLVMEHGGLAGPEQRARAVALGSAGSQCSIQRPRRRTGSGAPTRSGASARPAVSVRNGFPPHPMCECAKRSRSADSRAVRVSTMTVDHRTAAQRSTSPPFH